MATNVILNLNCNKMIARTVHLHTPLNQLEEPYFNKYVIKDIVPNVDVIDIDVMPCYA